MLIVMNSYESLDFENCRKELEVGLLLAETKGQIKNISVSGLSFG